MTAGVVEAVVVAVWALALLWRGEGVVVSLHVAVRLCVELGLERGKLLCDAEETSDLHTQDHPNDICEKKKIASAVTNKLCLRPSCLSCLQLQQNLTNITK